MGHFGSKRWREITRGASNYLISGRRIGSRGRPTPRPPSPEALIEPLWIMSSGYSRDNATGDLTGTNDAIIDRPEHIPAHLVLKWAKGVVNADLELGGSNGNFGSIWNLQQEYTKWKRDGDIKAMAIFSEEMTVADAVLDFTRSWPMAMAHLSAAGKYLFPCYPSTTRVTSSPRNGFEDQDGDIVRVHPNTFHPDQQDRGKAYAIGIQSLGLTGLDDIYNRFRIRYRYYAPTGDYLYSMYVSENALDSNVLDQTSGLPTGRPRDIDHSVGSGGLGFDPSVLCAVSQKRYDITREMTIDLPHVHTHSGAMAVLWYLMRRFCFPRIVFSAVGGSEFYDLSPGHILRLSDDVNMDFPYIDYPQEGAKDTGPAGSTNIDYIVLGTEKHLESAAVLTEFHAEQCIVEVTATLWTPDVHETTGLIEHLEADVITGVNNGDLLDTWQKTVGVDATAATTARPTYNTDVLNGFPAVDFSGVAPVRMQLPITNGVADYTFYLVCRPDDTGTGSIQVMFDSATGRLILAHMHTASANVRHFDGSYRDHLIASTAGWQVQTWKLQASPGAEFWRDGAQLSSAISYTQLALGGTTVIGSANGGGSWNWDGAMAEFLIYNVGHADATIDKVNGYLSHKYGRQGELPDAHFYKDAPPVI